VGLAARDVRLGQPDLAVERVDLGLGGVDQRLLGSELRVELVDQREE